MKNLISFSVLTLFSLNIISCTNLNLNNLNDKNISTIQTLEESLNKKVLVKFKSNVSLEEITKLNKSLGINNFNLISKDLNLGEFKITNKDNFEKIKAQLDKTDKTEYIEKDKKLGIFAYNAYPTNETFSIKTGGVKPNDTFYSLQWNMTDIDADKAWTITTGSSDVTVAVIDSGVDPDHPDLQDNLLPLIDVYSDLSGESDIYSFGINKVDYTGKDGNGHGTHVTGVIAAAINNAKGVAGISSSVKILPIKAANYEGNTSASIITKSIITAIQNNVRVINLSIGGPKSEGTQALQDSVNLAISKGIVFVSATGNESNRNNNFIEEVTVPAAYPGVIAVAAVTNKDKVPNYSNGGPEVEIAAPGGGSTTAEGPKIYSTWPTYRTYEGYRAGILGPYAYLSGTSMSCPHVSATAALLFSKYPSMNGQQARVRILSAATEIGQKGFNTDVGYGKLNVYKALTNNSHDKNQKTAL